MRFPNEAAIIGRIVVGFGELEFMMAALTGITLKNHEQALRTLYGLRTTSGRMDAAEALMRPTFVENQMEREQATALAVARYCLLIRNQYAHCNWADDQTAGLFFADVQDSAKRTEWYYAYKHVDVPILERQEAYLGYAREWLFFLEWELKFKLGILRLRAFLEPKELPQPPLHNPASQHIPPWISADEKARHIARAQVAEAPVSQPKRPKSALRLTEEEWIAKYRKEGRPLPDQPAE